MSDTAEKIVQMEMPPPPEEEFVEPLEEEELPLIEDELQLDEPVLLDEVADPVTDSLEEVDFSEAPEPELGPPAPFDGIDSNPILGAGGAAGARRGGPGGRAGGGGGRAVDEAIDEALEWLARHQASDGSWDGDGFDAYCGAKGAVPCDGTGSAVHDVGLTGLAILAFVGVGHTSLEGPYKETVAQAVLWMREQWDPDTGQIGAGSSKEAIYDHAIATLALCANYKETQSPILRQPIQTAVHYIQRARNPYGAWRYDVPASGRNDTSVTGWMIFAIAAARDAGFEVEEGALEGGLAWIEEVTDLRTGRTGYDKFGTLSARTRANEHFPPERGEAMTAVALLCRAFLGQTPAEHPVLEQQADLILRTPPEWDPGGYGCDMYYWYYGTYAMFQMGGRHWKAWERAMKPAILDSQRHDGDAAGSWDPVGPWGHVGGRVYATSLQTLSLQVYYRYSRLFGAR